jgi:chromosome segregation ATPase
MVPRTTTTTTTTRTTTKGGRQAVLEASIVWHQQAGRDAFEEVAAVRAALLTAEQRVQALERASQDAAHAHADCVRTMTQKLESMTAQVDSGRLTEQQLEQELDDARTTIDALRDELRAATLDHTRKVSQLERRCEKRQWRHLEQELAEVQEREAQAAAQYKAEITELRQAADQVPVLQEVALSWRIVVERMEKQLQEEHAIAARAVDESAGLKGTLETRAAVADGTIARLSARAEAGDQQRVVLCEAVDEWRRKVELERAGHAVEMSTVTKELRECKAALGKKNAEMVKVFTELTQTRRALEEAKQRLGGQPGEVIKELSDALAAEKAAHAETKERAVRLLKRASAATEAEKIAHADTKGALSAGLNIQAND